MEKTINDEKIKERNKSFHKKYDNKDINIDELESLFCESGFICIGHGTGRSNDDVIEKIFENGLRTKDNSLYYTTIVLSTPTEELIKQNGELGIDPPTTNSLKYQLDNWKHLDSKKIIIARIPTEYINYQGDRADLDGEMYGAFLNEIKQANGEIKYYLDSRFILGCYDANTKTIRINSKFEKELTTDTKEMIKEGYLKALKKTRTRLVNLKSIFRNRRG